MSDREEIYDLVVRYGRGLDTHDLDLLKSCFTQDAVVDYGNVSSEPIVGWSEIERFFAHGLEPMECAHHFSNFAFDVTGDTGSYSCYVLAQHWPRGSNPINAAFLTAGTRYDNRVTRTEEGWRIALTRQKTLWMSGDVRTLAHFEQVR